MDASAREEQEVDCSREEQDDDGSREEQVDNLGGGDPNLGCGDPDVGGGGDVGAGGETDEDEVAIPVDAHASQTGSSSTTRYP
jgi:hypothetical protein